MKLLPTLDNIIIKPDEEGAKSRILIPEAHRKTQDRGTVVVAGPGRRHIDGKVYDLDFSPGDKVIYHRMGIVPFEADGEKLIVLHPDNIICKVEE